MGTVNNIIHFFGSLNLINTLKLLIRITLISTVALTVATITALTVYIGCSTLYEVSPLSLAVAPTILLFGMPTLVWFIYGITNVTLNGSKYAQRRLR